MNTMNLGQEPGHSIEANFFVKSSNIQYLLTDRISQRTFIFHNLLPYEFLRHSQVYFALAGAGLARK